MTDLMQALRYPWQEAGWLGRILPLALLQLIPIVGQIILVGYGQAVARAIYSQQTALPRLELRQAFIDGLHLVAVGLVYCLPVILMVLLALSTSNLPETESRGGVAVVVLPLIMLGFPHVSKAIVKWRPGLETAVSALSALIGAVIAIFIILQLLDLFRTGQDLQFSTLQLNAASAPMLLIATLLSAFVVVALLVSGVRFAVTGSGLLKPEATLELMATNRVQTVRFIGAAWLLIAGTVTVTMIGSMFLIVPGLLLLVAGSVSIWFLAAQYAIKIGIEPAQARCSRN